MTAERPTNIKGALNVLNNEQLQSVISWADSRQVARRAETAVFQPAAPAQADLAPARPAEEGTPRQKGQGLGGAIRRFVSGVREPAEQAAPRKGFIEEINGSLANATELTGKVLVTPQALALYLQKLRPQDASLQNINIEILNGRSVQAKGKISKMGTSDFVVDLGADQDGGELKVVSRGLTNVARTHKGHTGEINQALGDILSTLQKKLDEDIADKTWHATGFSVSPDHQELVINFVNRRMEKARKDLAGAGIGSLKRLIGDSNLERPKLSDLARPALQKQGKPEPSQEELDSFAPEWVNWLADQIVNGRVLPGDSAVLELFALIDGADAAAIKDKVKEKLSAADTPWASAWKSYLTPPPPDAGGVPADFMDRFDARSRQRTQKKFARLYLELAITTAGRDLADARDRLQNPNLSLEEYAKGLQGDQAGQYLEGMRLSPRVMAGDIFEGKVLPDEEIWHKVNEMLTNEGDKQALRNELAARVKELAGRRESLSEEEQTWLEAWEKELASAAAQVESPQPAIEVTDEDVVGELQRIAGETDITSERLKELRQRYLAERRAREGE